MKKRAGAVIVAAMRWVDAINAPTDRSRLEAATAPDIVIDRMGVFDKQGKLAETFRGQDEVAAWLERMPDGVLFELGGDLEQIERRGKPAYELRYVYRIAEIQFVHGGTWQLQLSDDDRISWLRHMPEPLPEGQSAGGRDAGGAAHQHVH